jgi:phosphatidylinositol glycan class M
MRLFSIKGLLRHPVTIGLAVRFLLAWLLPWIFDDGRWIPGVAYTDIDYYVFTDAAEYVRSGGSPFQRTTYRYTPFLAELLAALPVTAARYIFCIADVLCGWIIFQARQEARQRSEFTDPVSSKRLNEYVSPKFQDALWWLYNPLAINICTRGSAEALIVLLPVLGTLWCVQQKSVPLLARALITGVVHGCAMHSKVYPVIYSLTLATALSPTALYPQQQKPTFVQWIKGFFSFAPILFGFSALGVWFGLTWLAVKRHGMSALTEGLLYHVSRVDHRHNYSGHWYAIYLARSFTDIGSPAAGWWIPWWGRVLLLPQVVWLILTSWWIASQPSLLPFAMFIQTLAFVAQNKVITAQYFTWYLILLPLTHTLQWKRQLVQAICWLLLSVVFWLVTAYLLEMQNLAVHRLVFIASWIFNAAHINLICVFLDAVTVPPKPADLSQHGGVKGKIE